MARTSPPAPINNNRLLAILSANIAGLCPSKGKHKLGLLYELALDQNIGILTITESHLNESFHDGEINMKGYSFYRADRTSGIRKGGVIVYLRKGRYLTWTF